MATHPRTRWSPRHLPANQKTQGQGIHLRLGRTRSRRQAAARRDARERADDRHQRAAPPGHRRHQDQEAALQGEGRRPDHGQGHHDVHPPARHDDEGRRAAAAVVRHRREGHRQRRGREAVHRHQGRRRDRHLAVAGVSQVPAVLRQPVLQPGRRRRTGRYPRRPAGPAGHVQGKDGGDQGQDQVGAVLSDLGAGRRIRRRRGDHVVRRAGVQERVRELRRRSSGPDPRGDGDLRLFHELLVPDLRRHRRGSTSSCRPGGARRRCRW